MKETNIFVKKRIPTFIQKSGWVFSFFLFFFSTADAQVNYVHNPSFEQYWRCPFQGDQIMYANFWSPIDSNWSVIDTFGNGDCSPDYCNTCSTTPYASVPINGFFYHYPRTGNGMAQVLMFTDSDFVNWPYQRDYLQGRLYKPLSAGTSYCVSFYVTQEQKGAMYAINHIGAYLDNGNIDTSINTCGIVKTQYTPQVDETGIINDTLNWVKIEGSFIANGTEKFITIGNFYDIMHTAHLLVNPGAAGGGSYYLVDDVSVIESDTKAFAWGSDTLYKGYLDSFLLGRDEIIPGIKWWRDGVLIDTLNAGIWCKDNVIGSDHTYIVEQTLCGLTTYDTVVVKVGLTSINVKNVGNVKNVEVWPNPVGDVLHIQTAEDVYVSILSVDGKVLLRDCFVPRNDGSGINVERFDKGVYFLQIRDENGNAQVRKIVK